MARFIFVCKTSAHHFLRIATINNLLIDSEPALFVGGRFKQNLCKTDAIINLDSQCYKTRTFVPLYNYVHVVNNGKFDTFYLSNKLIKNSPEIKYKN